MRRYAPPGPPGARLSRNRCPDHAAAWPHLDAGLNADEHTAGLQYAAR